MTNETDARDALWRKAASLFDASLIYSPAPAWHGVTDAHKIANIRSEFLSWVVLGRIDKLEYLAEHYWPQEKHDAALVLLSRLYRSAHGEDAP